MQFYAAFLFQAFFTNAALVLHSSKAIGKETTTITRRPGRTPPDPGLSPPIELSGGDAGGLLDLFGIGKTLPGERITAEEAPPALLQIEPARPGGDEDLMEARMRFQPGTGLEAIMAAEVISDNEDVARGIVDFDVGEQGDVPFGVARSGASGQFLAIAHP